VRPDGSENLAETISESPHSYGTSLKQVKFNFAEETSALRAKNLFGNSDLGARSIDL
jgi:hypothetical protein